MAFLRSHGMSLTTSNIWPVFSNCLHSKIQTKPQQNFSPDVTEGWSCNLHCCERAWQVVVGICVMWCIFFSLGHIWRTQRTYFIWLSGRCVTTLIDELKHVLSAHQLRAATDQNQSSSSCRQTQTNGVNTESYHCGEIGRSSQRLSNALDLQILTGEFTKYGLRLLTPDFNMPAH